MNANDAKTVLRQIAADYPPLVTVEQAAGIAQVPTGTIMTGPAAACWTGSSPVAAGDCCWAGTPSSGSCWTPGSRPADAVGSGGVWRAAHHAPPAAGPLTHSTLIYGCLYGYADQS